MSVQAHGILLEDAANMLGMGAEPDWAKVVTAAAHDARFLFRTLLLGPRLYECVTGIVLGPQGGRPIRLAALGPCDRSTSMERGAILRWRSVPVDAGGYVCPAIRVGAPGTELMGIKIVGPGRARIKDALGKLPEAPSVSSALHARARVVLEDCCFQNWRVSDAVIHLYGNGAVGSDVSGSTISRVRVDQVFGPGAGIKVQGADANVITVTQASVTNTHEGSAIVDQSFLGCTWIGCHVHPSERSEVTGGVNRAPPYRAEGRSSRATFVGCYAESGTEPSVVVPPNAWLGGIGGVQGGGFILSNGEVRGARLRAPVIVSEKWDRSRFLRVLRLEVETGLDAGGRPVIDFLEALYDGRESDAGAPLDKRFYGTVRWLWKNVRETGSRLIMGKYVG